MHEAVGRVMEAHGCGLLSRMVLVAEVVDEEGALGLLRGSSPLDMPVWSELGLFQYALADIQGQITAIRVAGVDEEDE
jgi:hypothetical protein